MYIKYNADDRLYTDLEDGDWEPKHAAKVLKKRQDKDETDNKKNIKVQPKSKFTEDELKSMQLIRVSEPISIDVLAAFLKTDAHMLERWNDDLFLQINKPVSKFYWLRLPKDKIDVFLNNRDEIVRKSLLFFGEVKK